MLEASMKIEVRRSQELYDSLVVFKNMNRAEARSFGAKISASLYKTEQQFRNVLIAEDLIRKGKEDPMRIKHHGNCGN